MAFCRGYLEERGYLLIEKERLKVLTISQALSFHSREMLGEGVTRYQEMLKHTAARQLGEEALQYTKVSQSFDSYNDITRYQLTLLVLK